MSKPNDYITEYTTENGGKYEGPIISAATQEAAQKIADRLLAGLKVVGRLIETV